jgi:hypothetical protein
MCGLFIIDLRSPGGLTGTITETVLTARICFPGAYRSSFFFFEGRGGVERDTEQLQTVSPGVRLSKWILVASVGALLRVVCGPAYQYPYQQLSSVIL